MSRAETARPFWWTSLLPLLLFACARTEAIDADIELGQLSHRAWGSTDTGTAQIRSIAQSPDGTLWLVSSTVLTSFDGLRFDPHSGPPFRAGNLTALTTSRDGALWVGDMWGTVTVRGSSGSTRFGERDGLPAAAIRAILQDAKNVVWVVSDSGLFRLDPSRWRRIGSAQGLPEGPALGALVSHDGTMWVATNDGVFVSAGGGERFQRASTERLTPDAPKYFAQAPDGAIWLSDFPRGLLRIEPQSTAPQQWLLKGLSVGPMLFDRDGNLWVGGDRLRRMTRTQLATGAFEELTRASGLSGDRVLSLFQDRDGFVWVGTDLGLDRFRHANVVWVRAPEVGRDKVVVAGDAGRVWVAHERGSLLAFDGPKLAKRLVAPRFTAGFRDRDGAIWFGGPEGVAQLSGERLDLTPLPAQARGFDVQAMARDGSGNLWVSIDRRGLYQLVNRRWIANPLPGLPPEAPLVAASDERGDVWFGYPKERLARVSGGSTRLFTAKDGLHIGGITALHAHGSRLWVGGEIGMAVFDGRQFVQVQPRSCQPFDTVSGLYETASDVLWVFRRAAVSRIEQVGEQLRQMDSKHGLLCESFGASDIPAPTPQQLRPTPSLTVASDGRVWLAANEGLAWIDPARVQPQITVLPEVRIDSLITDRQDRAYPFIFRRKYLLPANTKGVRIAYVAVNLAVSNSVHFRYRLLGSDPEWTATLRNEIVFVNLSPGTYRFEVVAANRDYNLMSRPAVVEFVIPPAFYQTIWFRVSCALLALLLLVLFVRMQIRNANERLRLRLEDRMRERERIARDLHDTLLQGIQALVLRFQGAAARIPASEPARDQMERALELADDVISESRERVHDLRDPGNADLPQEIARVGNEIFHETLVQFGVAINGVARSLHPIVREEALLIAREALTNAHRHARASTVGVNVFYERSGLRISVRDDGCGMDADVLRAGGRENHWGLLGMRERANRIHGSLEVWSRSGAGTEIELRVPASVAYRNGRARWYWPWGGGDPHSASPAQFDKTIE